MIAWSGGPAPRTMPFRVRRAIDAPRTRGPGALAIVLASILAAAPSALAQSPVPTSSSTSKASPVDPAQALFDAGVEDMEAGRFEKACPAIEASQRMDPRPGTLFTLAECEAQRGRVATAMRYYAEYLNLYRNFVPQKRLEQKERATTSEAQLKSLELLVPRLTLVLGPSASADVVVRRDGEIVPDLSLGTALPVDPGQHVITTEIPGEPPHEQRISLAPGESKTLRLEAGGPSASGASSGVSTASPSSSARASEAAASTRRAMRIGAFTAGAVGLAGIAAGVVTGVLAIRELPTVDTHCPHQNIIDDCDDIGAAAYRRLRALSTASTVSFVVGGVGLGASVVLFLAAPPAPASPAPASTTPPRTSGLRWQSVGLSVGGSF